MAKPTGFTFTGACSHCLTMVDGLLHVYNDKIMIFIIAIKILKTKLGLHVFNVNDDLNVIQLKRIMVNVLL